MSQILKELHVFVNRLLDELLKSDFEGLEHNVHIIDHDRVRAPIVPLRDQRVRFGFQLAVKLVNGSGGVFPQFDHKFRPVRLDLMLELNELSKGLDPYCLNVLEVAADVVLKVVLYRPLEKHYKPFRKVVKLHILEPKRQGSLKNICARQEL